jgi:hypothetical protein
MNLSVMYRFALGDAAARSVAVWMSGRVRSGMAMGIRYSRRSVGGVVLVFAFTVIAGWAARAPAVATAGASPSWRPLPTPPILGRLGASAVWTGREMIVWGGVTRGGAFSYGAPRSDGAAYTPATRTWRKIANSPSGVLGDGGPAAAWTGSRMVVWSGNSPDGPAGGAVYDPRTNTWRRLPKGPLGPREGYASVWTGRELLIFGGHTGDVSTPTAAAVNPATGSWRQLKALDAVSGLAIVNGALWDGREAIVSGNLYRHAHFVRPILFAFNPKTNGLREIDLSKAPLTAQQRSQLNPVGWTGTEVVFWIGASSSSSPVVRYNPSTGQWKKASVARCKSYGQFAWVGDRVIAACGTNQVQVYTPRSDIWNTINAGPSPLNSRQSSETTWTGTDEIVWSGIVNKPGNPTPADGAVIALNR